MCQGIDIYVSKSKNIFKNTFYTLKLLCLCEKNIPAAVTCTFNFTKIIIMLYHSCLKMQWTCINTSNQQESVIATRVRLKELQDTVTDVHTRPYATLSLVPQPYR